MKLSDAKVGMKVVVCNDDHHFAHFYLDKGGNRYLKKGDVLTITRLTHESGRDKFLYEEGRSGWNYPIDWVEPFEEPKVMRQFKHGVVPLTLVFQGDKTDWVDHRGMIYGPNTVYPDPSKMRDDYTELKPEQFVGLKALKEIGYIIPELHPMRQFSYKDPKYDGLWVHQGTKSVFFYDMRKGARSTECHRKLCELETCSTIKEFKPDEFVHLDELSKMGYDCPVVFKLPEATPIKTYEDVGFYCNTSNPIVKKMLIELAAQTNRKLGDFSNPNGDWFAFNGKCGAGWYGTYSETVACAGHTRVMLDEAVATLLKCAIPQTQKLASYGIEFLFNKKDKFITIGNQYMIPLNHFKETVKEAEKFMG